MPENLRGVSYSLYGAELQEHQTEKVSPEWEELVSTCNGILQKEEALREVAEIVGVEGLQDADRLLMHTAELIRMKFLCQNAYTDDAFSPPDHTLSIIREILDFYKIADEKLKQGVQLDEILKNRN
jgi:V/A-type H+-transporting ATPase subunit A